MATAYKLASAVTLADGPDGADAPDGAGAGYVRGVFATFGDRDKQGDVLLPGSIGDQAIALSGWQHSTLARGAAPVGRGRVWEQGGAALFEAQFFSDADSQRVYQTVKGLADTVEWSLGGAIPSDGAELRRNDAGELTAYVNAMRVLEVSPVLLGAQNGTGVLEIKAAEAVAPLPPPPGGGAANADLAVGAPTEQAAPDGAAADAPLTRADVTTLVKALLELRRQEAAFNQQYQELIAFAKGANNGNC